MFMDDGKTFKDFCPELVNYTQCYWEMVKMIGLEETYLLGYLLFQTQRTHSGLKERNDGWVYKTQKEILQDIGLRRSQQEIARASLRKLNLVKEHKKPKSNYLLFRVNKEKLSKLTKSVKEKEQEVDFEEKKMAEIPF